MGLNLNLINSGLVGTGKAALGFQGGQQQQDAENEAKKQAATQMMFKLALDEAAKRQTQSNSDRTFNLSKDRFDFEKTKKTPQDQISARVTELVGQGTPLLDASRQARQEFGRTTNTPYGSPQYIAGAVSLQKARDAAKVPRPAGGTASDPNSPVRASQKERYLSQVADRAMEAAGGDVNGAATALVQDPSTANIFSQGMAASHLNAAAARYRLRAMGKPASATPSGQPGASRPRLSDLIAAPATTSPQSSGASQQQKDWDEAAASLSQQGNSKPETVLGVRPQR